jgi:20S proteasome subunit alpha 2
MFCYSHTALLTLKEGFEGQMTEKTIEIGVIGIGAQISSEGQPPAPADGKKAAGLTFRKLAEAEVRDYLSL